MLIHSETFVGAITIFVASATLMGIVTRGDGADTCAISVEHGSCLVKNLESVSCEDSSPVDEAILSSVFGSRTDRDSTTLFVGGTGPNNYTEIQEALDDTKTGDTVFVYNGTYFESLLIVKQVTLKGESKMGTIIDANGTGEL